jgi:hypothetical protein
VSLRKDSRGIPASDFWASAMKLAATVFSARPGNGKHIAISTESVNNFANLWISEPPSRARTLASTASKFGLDTRCQAGELRGNIGKSRRSAMKPDSE